MNKLLTNGETNNIDLRQAAEKLNLPLRLIAFKDQLMNYNPQPGAYIINMEDSGNDGTHWVAFYLTKENDEPNSYYFDSYGGPPPMEVREFSTRYGAHFLNYSNKQIQSMASNYCGQYCLTWIEKMTNGTGSYEQRYLKFLHEFSLVRTI